MFKILQDQFAISIFEAQAQSKETRKRRLREARWTW